jgi:hypothetical protein
MTYNDLIEMRNNLDQVNNIEGANAKFVYAVAKNKRRLDQIIKDLDKMIEPTEELTEYRKAIEKINQEFAEKDLDGTVGYTFDPKYGRMYRKIVGIGNPESAYSRKIEKLKEKYKNAIDEHEKKVKSYTDLLKEDVPEDEYRKHMIDLDIVPNGLNPVGMSGCLEFIKDSEPEP